MRARVTVVAALALLGTMLSTGGARATVLIPGCADASHLGGEWRSYGGDLSNSRSQPLEDSIDTARAQNLAPVWHFQTSVAQPGAGAIESTPVVADGCVFTTTGSGWVFAINADTGVKVWSRLFVGGGGTLLGGVIVGSPLVGNGIVYVGVSRPGSPYVAALDEATGAVLWTTNVDQGSQTASLINASPVLYNGMIFQGFLGSESNADARGGYAILDAGRDCDAAKTTTCASSVTGATGGSILHKQFVIPDEDYAEGYRGASVWCSAAVDPATQYAFACGGNPASKKIEHRYSNALLKIDLAWARDAAGNPVASATITNPMFGTIVDSYKGQTDQYYPGLDRQPLCDLTGDDVVAAAWSVTCLQLDLDFGASPNLWHDGLGRLMLGDLQKSGIYHTLFADHMSASWTAIVGAPGVPFNADSGAVANGSIFTVGTPNDMMMSLTASSGRLNWAMQSALATHYQSVSTANGVVYTIDDAGNLRVLDAATGLPLAIRSIGNDAGAIQTGADTGSQGLSIARNAVFAASGEFVVMYR